MIVARDAVRGILLTKENEVLLLRIKPPQGGDYFWITPGGGQENGETTEVALKRELREELGLADFVVGPLVWRRQHTFNWGSARICQRERYYVVETDRFEPRMSDAVEAATLSRFSWWPASELAYARERLTPLSLAKIVAGYLAEGAPRDPPEVEVLVD
jgi:8-oxo-dGTP pyrophosphatase MutT (NUDIX family)